MKAEVEFLQMEEETPLPDQYGHLASLLETLVRHDAVKQGDIEYGDARDVGWRLTELLPCPNRYKQRLLEIKDPVARLIEIEKIIQRMQRIKQS